MTFDALAMHALHDELLQTIEGGHVDQVYLVDRRRVGLDIFAHGTRRTLMYSLDPSDSRVFLARDRARRGTEQVTPFLLLLRKYVRGSRIATVEQPRLERILNLRLQSHLEYELPREVVLSAEAMGRRSNLVLIDEDGSIMDVLDRVPPSVNPGRPLLPHLRYTTPPPDTKLDPSEPPLARELEGAARQDRGAAWSLVLRVSAGVSPLLAREVVARAGYDPEAKSERVEDWEAVARELQGLMELTRSHAWEPSIAWQGEHALEYAPYPLRQFPGARVQTYPSMSEVIELAVERKIVVPRFDRLRRPLMDALDARAEQARRKRSSLERSLASADRAEELRENGELLLANAHSIPPGALSFEWEGRRIDLYPTLTAVENAQSYFRQYTDARDARRHVPPLLEDVEQELQYLDEMATHVRLADSEQELSVLRRELEGAGVIRLPAKGKAQPQKKSVAKSPPTGPYRKLRLDGADLLVGGSAIGNDTVTFRLADNDDLWFHARGIPGSHVILRQPGANPTAAHLELAAGIAAGQSGASTDSRVEVDYTRRRYVRRISGDRPGRVTYINAATILVAPRTAESLRDASAHHTAKPDPD